MRSGFAVAVLLIAAVIPGTQAVAHHAFEAEFDCNAPMTLKGLVTIVEWVNPHTWIHLTVSEPGKSPQDWMAEGATPNTLLRVGLNRDVLKSGTAVTIRGFLPKDTRCLESPTTHVNTCKLSGEAISVEDGKWLYMGLPGDGAPYDPAEPTGCCEAVTYGVRTINLRNLGSGRDLVLFDGQPAAPAGETPVVPTVVPSPYKGCRAQAPK